MCAPTLALFPPKLFLAEAADLLCAVVQHTFNCKLEELRALKNKPSKQIVLHSGRTSAADPDPYVPSSRDRDEDGDNEDDDASAGGGGRKRQRSSRAIAQGASSLSEAGGSAKQARTAPKGMPKLRYAKQTHTWIDKFEAGKVSAEACISKVKGLLEKFAPGRRRERKRKRCGLQASSSPSPSLMIKAVFAWYRGVDAQRLNKAQCRVPIGAGRTHPRLWGVETQVSRASIAYMYVHGSRYIRFRTSVIARMTTVLKSIQFTARML